MKTTVFKTRKFDGETYTFYLHTPEFKGEKGCIGIELQPYITVETPENCFGYTDTFFYDHNRKSGYYSWRQHPRWITNKIIEVCNKYADSLPYSIN